MKAFSGFLIFLSFVLTLYSYFFQESLLLYAGVIAWIAMMTLFTQLNKKRLLLSLLTLTAGMLWYSFSWGFEIDFSRLILVNQHLLTLLIGVGFLKLIALPKKKKLIAQPQGKRSFIKTYFGVHLFGSVINLSSMILVADKFHKNGPLSKLQLLLLTRAFSSDAFWSPFFVAFAAVIIYAPDLSKSTIISLGLVIAIISFMISYLEANKHHDLDEFKGYPIQFETLYIPVFLALMVLGINHYEPELKVILLIALFSLILCFVILPVKEGGKVAYRQFKCHIGEELPLMKNELALFLIAGAFGVALSTLLLGFNVPNPLQGLDGQNASILLLVLIILAFIGIHPIISIAAIGMWIPDINHTLFALTFLIAWGITVSTSLVSGLNLTIQARYNISAVEIFKINLPYAIKMYLVGMLFINGLAFYLGL